MISPVEQCANDRLGREADPERLVLRGGFRPNRRHSVIRSNMAGNVAEVLEPQWIYSLIHFRGCEKVLVALFEYTNRNRVV